MPVWLLSPWFWLALAVAAAGVATKGWISEHDAFVGYQAAQEALAKDQESRTTARIKQDKANQEQADAELKTRTAERDAALKRLRNKPDTGFVPPAPADSDRPDLACFDRAEYQRADGVFTAGARRLSDQGTANTTALDVAKGWANRLSQTLTR